MIESNYSPPLYQLSYREWTDKKVLKKNPKLEWNWKNHETSLGNTLIDQVD